MKTEESGPEERGAQRGTAVTMGSPGHITNTEPPKMGRLLSDNERAYLFVGRVFAVVAGVSPTRSVGGQTDKE